MRNIDNLEEKLKKLSIILIFLASILLVIWIATYYLSEEQSSPILLAISISLMLAGMLLFTRIQYTIWVKKGINKSRIK